MTIFIQRRWRPFTGLGLSIYSMVVAALVLIQRRGSFWFSGDLGLCSVAVWRLSPLLRNPLRSPHPPQRPNPRRRWAGTARRRSAGPPSVFEFGSVAASVDKVTLVTAPSLMSSSLAGGSLFHPLAPTRRKAGLHFELHS